MGRHGPGAEPSQTPPGQARLPAFLGNAWQVSLCFEFAICLLGVYLHTCFKGLYFSTVLFWIDTWLNTKPTSASEARVTRERPRRTSSPPASLLRPSQCADAPPSLHTRLGWWRLQGWRMLGPPSQPSFSFGTSTWTVLYGGVLPLRPADVLQPAVVWEAGEKPRLSFMIAFSFFLKCRETTDRGT